MKLTKQILSLGLAIGMMFSMSIGVSANTQNSGDSIITRAYSPNYFQTWKLYSNDDPEAPVMNVYTWSTTTNADGNKVNLYNYSSSDPAQKFSVKFHVQDSAPRLYSQLGFNYSTSRGYTLNYNQNTSECTMWNDNIYNRVDSEIDVHTLSSGIYKIYLPQRGLYLNHSGEYITSQLKWEPYATTYWLV